MDVLPFPVEPSIARASLTERVHQIGRDVIAPAANDVDQSARFPAEAAEALRELELFSAYVPRRFGGLGLSIREIARLCEILGEYCGSAAMVFAMHQIQAACIVHHAARSAYFEQFLRDLVARQFLIASATTEIGVG